MTRAEPRNLAKKRAVATVAITLLMKWTLLQLVVRHPSIRSAGVEVAARLLDHLNSGSGQCNPSYQTLAEATGLSRDTVMASIRDLEAAGILQVTRSVEPGRQASKGQALPSNSFEFNFGKLDQSIIPTTPSRKNRPPQSKIPTTPVGNADHPQSEIPARGSRKFRPKAGKEETGNIETGKEKPSAPLIIAAEAPTLFGISDQTPALPQVQGNGRKQSRRQKTDLPDDWVLSDDQWSHGAKLGLTGEQIEEAQRKLKRWVKREGKRYVDWNAFVLDWLEREVAFLRKPGRGDSGDDREGFAAYVRGGVHGS